MQKPKRNGLVGRHLKSGFCTALVAMTAAVLLFAPTAHAAEVPVGFDTDGLTVVANVHAEGVQVYECKGDLEGKTHWQFREPLATLIQDGVTVGRHFSGPSWEFTDGSSVIGKVVAEAPGATKDDIPLLVLRVVKRRGDGVLAHVTTVQRLDTHGGIYSGRCGTEGAVHVEPYSAQYVFLTGRR
ncbi:DUF3455 domain-containing protein [Phyllobacterium sp. LjRoot231]|uniref:DUF3455 domain-containing protein n=1 Tax=Phyllobacterium sp. LjRoot231 TaxID=3342289 RepID=UPI003ECE79A1